MRRHYVYYRVPLASLHAVIDAATAMQTGLRDRVPGLNTSLLRRPEVTADRVTLMEVYALPESEPDGPLAAVIEDQASAALARWTDGPRHVERFDILAGDA